MKQSEVYIKKKLKEKCNAKIEKLCKQLKEEKKSTRWGKDINVIKKIIRSSKV